MVFEEKDLNELAELRKQYEEMEKKLRELRLVIEKRNCTTSKPDFDATQAFLAVQEDISDCLCRLHVAQLLAEIAYARQQQEVDWIDIENMEMTILEYDPNFQECQFKWLLGR